jgi:hypothetical protein
MKNKLEEDFTFASAELKIVLNNLSMYYKLTLKKDLPQIIVLQLNASYNSIKFQINEMEDII